MVETFDVFLSHNSKDKPLVRKIAKRLEEEYELSPWLDEWDLRPGVSFRRGLEEAMQTTRAAAVFVGAHGLGPWQQAEIDICVSQLVNRGQPVVPVLLRGAPDKPQIGLFLEQITWVDLRKGLSAKGIERLVWGITGEKPRKRILLEGAPQLTSHFQGRKAEVGSCLAAMRSSHLVTVVGLPGAGKTELSLAAAREALGDPALRPQRALWFSLAGVRSSEELANRLALAFRVSRLERIEDLAAAIGKQRVLLLLDNAEDLIGGPARQAFQELCGTLLRLCPGLRLLLSSRRGLGNVTGFEETEVPVRRLQPPYDLKVFRSAAAARLAPEELQSSDLEALVAALDGHPLSLMLLAGQAGRGMSLAALRRRVERDRDAAVMARELLGDAEADSTPDERLRTKRLISSLNLSYSPLTKSNPAAAEIFLWLGLFPAGLFAGLVPAVFGEQGEENVALLLDHNLAELVRGRDTRLLLPAPVRWYAKRRMGEIPSERQAALLTTTLRSLGQLLEAAAAQSLSEHAPRSLGLALREEPNLIALIPEALRRTGGGPEWAECLADTLVPWGHLMSRAGQPSAALKLVERAAAAISAEALGTPTSARFLGTLGDLYERTDRLRDAEGAYQRALATFQQIEDRFGEANARKALGNLYVRTARLRMAEDAYQSALAIFQKIKDRLREAHTRQALGYLYVRTDRLRDAEDAYQRALPISQQIEDRLGEANTRKTLGDLYGRTDRLRDAEDAYQRALVIYQQIEDPLGKAATLQGMGNLAIHSDISNCACRCRVVL